MQKKLAVLLSNAGTGTNLQAIIDAIAKGILRAKISVVISDKEDAIGLNRAKKHKIPTRVLQPKEELVTLLEKTYPVNYIVLTGWKKIIPEEMINAFPNKIINIHPGLIPDAIDAIVLNPDKTEGLWNKGKFTDKAIKNFLDRKATYAGSSVHFLTNEFDFGPVVGRCWEKIRSGETVDTLYSRVKKKENKMYVEALIKLTSP